MKKSIKLIFRESVLHYSVCGTMETYAFLIVNWWCNKFQRRNHKVQYGEDSCLDVVNITNKITEKVSIRLFGQHFVVLNSYSRWTSFLFFVAYC